MRDKKLKMPVEAKIVKEDLGGSSMTMFNLKKLGLLKVYNKQHGYYTYESYSELKEFAEDFKSEYGLGVTYPTPKHYLALFKSKKLKGSR